MPVIYDNIDETLLPALKELLRVSKRADFCVGYFNLRGWKEIAPLVDPWEGKDDGCCRLLVGMHTDPDQELRAAIRNQVAGSQEEEEIDQAAVKVQSIRLAEYFAKQLGFGAPSNEDERGLKLLAAQLRSKKLRVKLHARYPLHAKLYLLHDPTDPRAPITGIVGSSNLTFAGLKQQGELNVDVTDRDAAKKLSDWFNKRWDDRRSVDISDALADLIENSWITQRSPYEIYLKIAYHLSQEARAGISEYTLPAVFEERLFRFQKEAVKVAARYIEKQGGVLIGDVVGLGKTILASAIIKMLEEFNDYRTLILCPKNLRKMWSEYKDEYDLKAKIRSMSNVKMLDQLKGRFHLVVIDESHNLRNREGARYKKIKEFIGRNGAKCILLSATPYNKGFLDLSNQLRLFLAEDKDLPVRPERLLREIGDAEFMRKHQCQPRTLAGFEKSEHPEDWRELMRLFLIRRTRSFIINSDYVDRDEKGKPYLRFADGKPTYFPTRVPKNVTFSVNENDPQDQYARLYSEKVVETINSLCVPRYGLGNYVLPTASEIATPQERAQMRDLGRAGKRLMGFCRTNLFKRLESSGHSFLLSVERHILRNVLFIYAIKNGLPLPLGTQDQKLIDSGTFDLDADDYSHSELEEEEQEGGNLHPIDPAVFERRAKRLYELYTGKYSKRFKWIRPELFKKSLRTDLEADNKLLLGILKVSGGWDSSRDEKLKQLQQLLSKKTGKVLIFTQFSDTARYLAEMLKKAGMERVASVTGEDKEPTNIIWRFSPVSNKRRDSIPREREIDVLISTDVLSEGQNLQDAHEVVNFDIPWAIIRLVQRAGRIDRIGQTSEFITCHSFWPADGVEKLILLRKRIRDRLHANREVLGSDESFFEEEDKDVLTRDLYKGDAKASAVLEMDDDLETDLASRAYEIWQSALKKDPSLEKKIQSLPEVVYTTKHVNERGERREPGVLAFIRSAEQNDELVYLDKDKNVVTESQFDILEAARSTAETPIEPRRDDHHALVQEALRIVDQQERSAGGQLGKGVRRRLYNRLKPIVDGERNGLFRSQALERALDLIYKNPLSDSTKPVMERHLRQQMSDDDLKRLVLSLLETDSLVNPRSDGELSDPFIVCSMGLI